MKGRYILLLAALFSCISCLHDDKQPTYPQAAITSFTIGYYNVRFHDFNIHGRDTLVYLREGGVMYPMTIDQVNNRIFNADSMAFGSDLSRVTSSVYGTGTVGYRYLDDPETTYLWNASDSIDFTRNLQFVIVSTDGSYTRTYDVEVNVRKVFPDSLLWSGPDTKGFPVLSSVSPVLRNDTVFCFGIDSDGTLSVSFRYMENGDWNGANALSGLSAEGWGKKVALCNGRFYTVVDGTLYSSADALQWSPVKTGIKSIIVSGEDYGMLWAVSKDNDIVKSYDMIEWTIVQNVPEHFPDSEAVMFSYPLATNASLSRSVLVGASDDINYSSVWTMVTGDTVWTRIDTPANTALRLPRTKNISLIRYDGALFCFGQGFEGFRQSNDNGVTWYKCDSYVEDYSSWNRYMQLPAALKESEVLFAGVSDSKGRIWIMTEDGRVFCGAINRLKKH